MSFPYFIVSVLLLIYFKPLNRLKPELYHPIIDSITELLRIMTMCVGDALQNIRDQEKGNNRDPLTISESLVNFWFLMLISKKKQSLIIFKKYQ